MRQYRTEFKNPASYITLYLKGVCMGIADLIPGISGGTIAFITGIYEDLIEAIKSFNLQFIRECLSFKLKKAFTHVNWRFLVTLLAGIFTSVFSLSKVMHWLWIYQAVWTKAFFLGLIAATVPIIGSHIKDKWAFKNVAAIAVSTVITYYIVGLVPVTTPEYAWFIFLSGAIGVCAMILPGISGSFILLVLGKYEFIIAAVSNRDFATLLIFAAGGLTGLLSIVRFLSWLLHKYHNPTLAVLTGLVIGSMRKIWPWTEALETMTTPKGKVIILEEINVLPSTFGTPEMIAVVFIALGFAAAYLLSSVKTEHLKTTYHEKK